MKKLLVLLFLIASFNLYAVSPDTFECYKNKEMTEKWFAFQYNDYHNLWLSYFADLNGDFKIVIPLFPFGENVFSTGGTDLPFQFRFYKHDLDEEGHGTAEGALWSNLTGIEFVYEGAFYCEAYTFLD